MKRTLAVLFCSCIGSAACGDDAGAGAAMTLQNNPFVKLPRARATSNGTNVTISTVVSSGSDAYEGFESLAAGSTYHGWAGSGGTYTHLGQFTPGADLTGAAAGATDVAISIESATPGAAPSVIVVSGPIGYDLSLGSLNALAFSDSSAEVAMDWNWIELAYRSMPALPGGYHYELWVVELDAQNIATGTNVQAGTLSDPPTGDMTRYNDDNLPTLFDLRVTIEAAAGTPAMSDCVPLKLQHDHGQHAH